MNESGVLLFRLGSRGCSTPSRQARVAGMGSGAAPRPPTTCTLLGSQPHDVPIPRPGQSCLRSAPRPHAAPRTGRGVSPREQSLQQALATSTPGGHCANARSPSPSLGASHRCFSFPSSSSDPLCCQQMRSPCFLIGNGVTSRGLVSSNAVVDEEH